MADEKGTFLKSTAPRLLIVLVFALLGASIGKVASLGMLPCAIGGGVIASIAVFVAALFSKPAETLEKLSPPSHLLWMRIAMIGGSVALCGWFVGVFVSYRMGYFVAAPGVLIGSAAVFIGFIVTVINRR